MSGSEAEHQRTKPSASDPSLGQPPASPRPPRSAPWWLLLTLLCVAALSGWIGAAFGDRIAGAVRSVVGVVDESAASAASPDHNHTSSAGDRTQGDPSAATRFYTCGMHPWVILPRPGDCPICHMKLTPLDPAKFTGEVAIDPVVVQNIGVRVEPVTTGPLVKTIRTVGTIDYDETRVRDVNTKVSGWIERLYVDYVGAPVTVGAPLFDVYSPALYQAQEEYLLALRTQGGSPERAPDAGDRRLDLVSSARTKLELLDVTPEQIDELARAGRPSRTITIRSPYEGVVIAKHANEGMKIDPGMQVYRIADLSEVWALVTLYESQLPFVTEGQAATMTLPYIPGQKFEGRVIYIYPYVDTRTREAQLRLEFGNPGGLLKPGMFATVELHSNLRQEAVLAPRAAVISTGERDMAFISLGEGRFEPRRVHLGVATDDGNVQILDGLRAGELVVTSGQFLLDSESRMREALAKMVRGDLASDRRAHAALAGPATAGPLPESVSKALAGALRSYFELGGLLASDRAAGLGPPAEAVATALDAAIKQPIPQNEHFWHEHTEAAVARGAALAIATASDLPAARAQFADLSVALDRLFRAAGAPRGLDVEVQSLHCPMFREGQGGAVWLQAAGPVRNPYFGSSMLGCFDRRETLPEAGSTTTPAPTAGERGGDGVPPR